MACAVPYCRSYARLLKKTGETIGFHRFPVNNNLRKKWIDAVGRNNWMPKKHHRICSKHFETNCFVIIKNIKHLLPEAIPTVFQRPLEGSHQDQQLEGNYNKMMLSSNERLPDTIPKTSALPLQILISSDEEYGICEVCVLRLRDARDFKLQVQRSQAELQARLQGASNIKGDDSEKTEISDDDFSPDCQEELTNEDPEKIEISDDDLGPDFREELIYVSEDMENEVSDDPLLSDEREVFKESATDEEKECPEVYSQEPLCPVSELPRKEHSERPAEGPLAKQKRDNMRETCAQDTPSDSETHGHHELKPYTCDICGKRLTTQAGRNKHISQVHCTKTEHICRICDRRFKWRSLLEKHKHIHTVGQP